MDTSDDAAMRCTTAPSRAGQQVISRRRGPDHLPPDGNQIPPDDEQGPTRPGEQPAPVGRRGGPRPRDARAPDRGWPAIRGTRGWGTRGWGPTRPLALVVLAVFAVQAFLWTFQQVRAERPDTPLLTGCLVVLVVLFGIQIYLWAGALTGRGRWDRWPWVIAHGALAGVPLLVVGDAWLPVPGFFIGTVLLSMARPQSWLVAGGLVAAVGGVAYATTDWVGTSQATVSAAAVALVVYGVVRLAHAVTDMRATRAALARSAVAQERQRIGRDLHDLLGHSLSSVVLRGELALRLFDSAPETARQELSEVIAAARQATTDLRGVASRCRRPSFEAEVYAARAVLQAAGIECRATVTCGRLPEPTSVMLGWVVREAVTNVLNHSHATICVVDAAPIGGRVHLTITNNGADRPGSAAASRPGGSGLRNLRERVELAGGTLTTPVASGGWFRLTAVLPSRPRRPYPTLSATTRF